MKLEHFTDYVLTSDNKEVQNSIAIQRKTIGEVLSQFKEIQTRLHELQKYGVPWLLVEENGMFINANGIIMSKRGKILYETGVKAQSYYNFLHSIQRAGTNVKTTRNWEDSIWWLYSLHKYIQKQHYPKLNRTYTKKEEIVGALQTISNVGSEKAQQIYGIYELLYKPLELLMPIDTSIQNIQTVNSLDANPLMLKAFDKLLTRVKSVLMEQRFSKSVLIKQLKMRITKDEVLLSMFISVLVDDDFLQKEQIGKHVYYSVSKNREDKGESTQTEGIEDKKKRIREEQLNDEMERWNNYKKRNNIKD